MPSEKSSTLSCDEYRKGLFYFLSNTFLYRSTVNIFQFLICKLYMVEQIKEFLYFFIHIVIQILRIDEAGQQRIPTIRFGP